MHGTALFLAASLLSIAACATEGREGFAPGSGETTNGTLPQGGGEGGAVSTEGGVVDSPDGGGSTPDGGAASDGSALGDAASDGSSVVPPAPFAGNPCTGAAITSQEVLSHFPTAATTTTFGTVWAAAQKRNCQDQTGCQAWQPASSVDLYKINWTGSGFTFINPTTLQVPATGTITCTVPGPSCTLSIAPMTSNVYPPEQGRPLGITPRIAGAQVQVGNWVQDPHGNYLQYSSSFVGATCLWGTMSGRVYGASGTYVETQLVVWGSY
jgi:hypothetical protein